MPQLRWTALLPILLVSACSSDSAVDTVASPGSAPLESVAPIELPPPSTGTANLTDATAAFGLTEVNASKVEMADGVDVDYTVYELSLDAGTQWELPVFVPVPLGWRYDPADASFSGGESSITLSTSCLGPCEVKAWERVMFDDESFLQPVESSATASVGFSSRFSSMSSGQTASRSYTEDDGSGRSFTGLYHDEGARMLGCVVDTKPGGHSVETLETFCQSITVDWTGVLDHSPLPEIPEIVTASAAAIIGDPAPGVARQTVLLEADENDTVEIALPEGATVDLTGFGNKIDLGDDWSIFSEIDLSSSCDGFCEPKNWEQELGKPSGTLFRWQLSLVLDNNTPLEDGWLLSGASVDGFGDSYEVIVLRWADEAPEYLSCHATVDDADVDRIDEVMGYCLSARPMWVE